MTDHRPRPGRHFTDQAATEDSQAPRLRPGRRFDPSLEQTPVDHSRWDPDQESLLEASGGAAADAGPGAARRPRHGLFAAVGGAILLGTLELLTALGNAWTSADLLGLAWGGLGLVILLIATRTLISEVARARRLDRHDRLREALARLPTATADDITESTRALARHLSLDQDAPDWQALRDALEPHHDGQETRDLLEHHLMVPRDRAAIRLISRMSSETAVMVAVSPLTLVDMALVAWRHLVMVNRITRLYGLELSRLGRIKLWRQILHDMAFAGAAEMATDTGIELLSLDLTGRLSARASQGLASGLLAARLGLRAQALCRPLPFTDATRPRLGDLRRKLWQRLRRLDDTA